MYVPVNDARYDERSVAVVIFDADATYLGTTLDSDTTMTLIAVASEDPNDWNEVIHYWTRYRTDVVSEFASSLAIQRTDRAGAIDALHKTNSWVVLDLVQKRVLTGPQIFDVERDQVLMLSEDESGDERCPLSIHLAPWWDLHDQVEVSAVQSPRQRAIEIPSINRGVLFGEPFVSDIASRILAVVEKEAERFRSAMEDQETQQELTRTVHRDWLMTQRQDLDGLSPRQLLHGGRHWIDQLIWSQQLRLMLGETAVAASDNGSGFETTAMSSEEVIVYFDLCRKLIGSGWLWCANDQGQQDFGGGRKCQRELAEFLRNTKEEWLTSPYEGGSSPNLIIEYGRRRAPRAASVVIAGMSEPEPPSHPFECDCPICETMGSQSFGVAIQGIDGHHLELEDDFVFSMIEREEDWEKKRRDQQAFDEQFAIDRATEKEASEAEPDEFASAWSGEISTEPIPGDKGGHLKLAFLLTEIVTVLRLCDAEASETETLRENFVDFRTCDRQDLLETTNRLKQQLQTLAVQFPTLVSKAADFQSRLDEHNRVVL